MKSLFFIAALAGAVYLVLQTPAGKAWLAAIQAERPKQTQQQMLPELLSDKTPKQEKQTRASISSLNQQHTIQVAQLQKRIADLESQLTKATSASTPPSAPIQAEQQVAKDTFVALPKPQSANVSDIAIPQKKAHSHDQRKRQARLQDIAQRMEMSSLHVLLNE